MTQKTQSFDFWLYLRNPRVAAVGFVDMSLLIICVIFNDGSICGLGICLKFGLVWSVSEIASRLGSLAWLALHSVILRAR